VIGKITGKEDQHHTICDVLVFLLLEDLM